jgi:hypothetical protein
MEETISATTSLEDLVADEILLARGPLLVLSFEQGERVTQNLRGFLKRFDCVVVRSEDAPRDLLATFTFDALLVNLGPVADPDRRPRELGRLLGTLSVRYPGIRLIIRTPDPLRIDERLVAEGHGAIVHHRREGHSRLVRIVRKCLDAGARLAVGYPTLT